MIAGPLSGKTVLMVEDEYLIADALCSAFEMEDVRVVGPFSNVASAMDALDKGATADAAVLDVNLNGERVFPLADRLMADNVPIVLTTGYDGDAIPRDYAHLERLQKPVHLRELFGCLKGLLAK
ncbi:response regulator [Dyella flagellata]|uniref:Response regulator n=1 Tax=Dyella flagellata TaxID=1867833 RepID=A0ABQ5X7B3_9GAMM|nr:response regulator [Dyella flagellata]GLQ87470.1 response regulator [Dyella flagellata]